MWNIILVFLPARSLIPDYTISIYSAVKVHVKLFAPRIIPDQDEWRIMLFSLSMCPCTFSITLILCVLLLTTSLFILITLFWTSRLPGKSMINHISMIYPYPAFPYASLLVIKRNKLWTKLSVQILLQSLKFSNFLKDGQGLQHSYYIFLAR